MNYLHTMIRVGDLDGALAFFALLGLSEIRRMENEKGRFTLVYLAAPDDVARAKETDAPMIELQLDVRGCEPDRLSLWLRERFGAPRTSTPTWTAWDNRKLYLIAESPTDSSRCCNISKQCAPQASPTWRCGSTRTSNARSN